MNEQEAVTEEVQQFDMNKSIKDFLQNLKKKNIKFSSEIASETIKLLERVVTNSEWETANDLMKIIRDIGKTLTRPFYVHTVVGNMVKRTLKIIRDEYLNAVYGKIEDYDVQESLQKMVSAQEDEEMDYSEKVSSLKKSISANLRELMEECERSPEVIAMQSEEHIHSDEVILTFGYSRTVEKFLKAAAKRICNVIVVQGGRKLGILEMAKSLMESGIKVTLISSACMLPIMPHVNKVIVGAHCVMGNGGLKAVCGVHPLALAAEHHSVPFYVLAPVFKLTPQYVSSSDQEGFNHNLPPEELLSFEDIDLFRGVEVVNPAYDYVPPDKITLIIFNTGGNSPSYAYRPLKELYHPDDHEL
ncbi:translation initiation factor eIF-2B subunit beta-like [Argiope bruennichi]|uniref:Translation initiation factor eIF2B subunit beta n=1 Tax=Argiope bruennichi TaxID=94029 RepID=A0A8T0DYW4_ARGBR|nr:translation initiation factor eIF-2B subunit beta-like [Argiope bruennichi]XP_055936224.1 translation initiation factor eIF-2B subunit beta-like [Argiope bruennichi]XP_055936233.1 translation initiation factor eIF-2B subunit beta-like [Argiope bruennichi]KAF8763386.1 Translation initiation factor eIF-2B subunit like protein [Argiope bruennichi]